MECGTGKDRPTAGDGGFEVVIDGRKLVCPAGRATGTDLAALAGLDPPEAHVLVRIDRGAGVWIRRDEPLRPEGSLPILRSARREEPWTLVVDGEPWAWPAPEISAADLRVVAGLSLDTGLSSDGVPVPVRHDASIRLDGVPPRVSTLATSASPPTGHRSPPSAARVPVLTPQPSPAPRPAAPPDPGILPPAPALAPPVPERAVPVIVNGRPRELANPDATFEDLVRLAFPQIPAADGRTFTVTYRRGDAGRPEGSLLPRQAARLAPGAVINVSATDRS